jgi:predicted RNase H-like HicB family nuclease
MGYFTKNLTFARAGHILLWNQKQKRKDNAVCCKLGGNMLTQYIQATMRKAKYEILTDDNSYYGEIPGFDGVYAYAKTLEECRNELEEVLEEWIFFKISKNLPLPVVEGLEINIREAV